MFTDDTDVRNTSIPSLDDCLRPDASSGQSALQPGDVLEIQGPPASGKTHVAYQTIISCILPHSPRHHGWGKAAMIYDTDGTFQLKRLKALLYVRLIDSDGIAEDTGGTTSSFDELVANCLSRVYVFRPTSSIQLAATILNLGHLHATHDRFVGLEIGLVVVDSLSSFYWQDRFTVEQFRVGPSGHNTTNPLQHVLSALENIRVSHRPIILLTNWGLNPIGKPGTSTGNAISPFFKQHLHLLKRPSSPIVHGLYPIVKTSDDHSASNPPGQTSSRTRGGSVDPGQGFTHLPLMHHVTLQLSSASSGDMPTTLSHGEQNDPSQDRDDSHVEGFVRSSGSSQIKTFRFQIRTGLRRDDLSG
ncbi:hypothetical protein BDY19DRAFT_879094 [Irpex rosettiformis]|uniref:Uncharacterized protein n=1 Tax=Irpex rosettiformis TaxID=378272 RepID=A0ACB8UKT1_9APHY|nr:hypothetical protein BDY19DRAFT_879094 [Irpex rosettiformis]